MSRMPWATYLWPGLPQLWFSGLWSGLVLAAGSPCSLTCWLAASFVWVELLRSVASAVGLVGDRRLCGADRRRSRFGSDVARACPEPRPRPRYCFVRR